jgi:hypothetical protein
MTVDRNPTRNRLNGQYLCIRSQSTARSSLPRRVPTAQAEPCMGIGICQQKCGLNQL